MEEFFKIKERGSTVSREVLAGFTMFLACAYIVAVNPMYLTQAGIPFAAALTATCIGAGIMTIIMGFASNRPIAMASGMGINAVVVFTICIGQGVDWRVAMSCVFLEGIVILILVLAGLREAIMNAIPAALRDAIGIGIGLFIAFIGLKGAGIISPSESTLLTIGSMSNPTVALGLISILIAAVLFVLDVKGSLLISIVASTLIGIPMGVTVVPDAWTIGFDLSTFAAPFQQLPDGGGLAIAQVFYKPILLMFVFSLLMSDFFDTMGTVLAIGRKADFADEDGNVENLRPILTVDSAAAAVGGFIGASSITTFAESTTAGVAGGRTGLASLVAGILFLLCPLLSPFFGMVSSAATCGALTMVGYLMMRDVVHIDWSDIGVAFPAFAIIMGIPFTYSITNGIGLGFISYVIIRVFQGRAKEIHPLMWVSAAAFLVMFLLQ